MIYTTAYSSSGQVNDNHKNTLSSPPGNRPPPALPRISTWGWPQLWLGDDQQGTTILWVGRVLPCRISSENQNNLHMIINRYPTTYDGHQKKLQVLLPYRYF